MKKTSKKLIVNAQTIRLLSSDQIARAIGGASALCPTQSPECTSGTFAANGCCSTNYTKAYTCPSQYTC